MLNIRAENTHDNISEVDTNTRNHGTFVIHINERELPRVADALIQAAIHANNEAIGADLDNRLQRIVENLRAETNPQSHLWTPYLSLSMLVLSTATLSTVYIVNNELSREQIAAIALFNILIDLFFGLLTRYADEHDRRYFAEQRLADRLSNEETIPLLDGGPRPNSSTFVNLRGLNRLQPASAASTPSTLNSLRSSTTEYSLTLSPFYLDQARRFLFGGPEEALPFTYNPMPPAIPEPPHLLLTQEIEDKTRRRKGSAPGFLYSNEQNSATNTFFGLTATSTNEQRRASAPAEVLRPASPPTVPRHVRHRWPLNQLYTESPPTGSLTTWLSAFLPSSRASR